MTTGRSVMTTVGAVQTSTGQVHFGCLSDHQLAGKSTVFHRRRLVSTELKSASKRSTSVGRFVRSTWGPRFSTGVGWSPQLSCKDFKCGKLLFVLLWLLQPEWKNLPHSIIFINRKWWKFLNDEIFCCCGPVWGRREWSEVTQIRRERSWGSVNGLRSLKFTFS